jgi:hypothetical protein
MQYTLCIGYERQFILYGSKVGVISEIHMKHVNARCGHNVELFSITHDGTGSSR